MLHLTAPATGGTPLRRRTSLGARPETPGAGLQSLNLNRLLNAGCRLFQRQLEIVPQVGAGFGGIAVDAAAPPAEKHVKDVIERTESPAGHILGGDRLHRPEPVILGPALRVAEYPVGLVDFLAALVGLRVILSQLGGGLAGQPAACPCDLVLRDGGVDTEDLIMAGSGRLREP